MGKHAIMVVKNDRNEYLQYYDSRWDANLFLNCKVDYNDDAAVIRYISDTLDIKPTDITCEYIDNIIHTKLSIPNNIKKEYQHYFYKVSINNFKHNQEKKFNIKGINYTWYSFNELLNDPRIQEVNSDIVEFIRKLNM